MRAKRELRLFLSVAAIVLLLAFIFFSYAQQQDTTKSSVPILTEVEKRFTPKAGEKPKETPSLSEVERRFLPREQESPKEIPSLSGVERKFLPRGGPFPLEVAQLPEVGWPEVREFKDFKGGLDLSTAKTKVPPDRAIVLENALWNEQGEMYKRPGYDTLKTTPEVFNFLYRYYQQDGDKYLMGGSDTALYFWEADSTAWTYLIGTEGTSGRWDGTTYDDVFVGTHEGIKPIIWDGVGFVEIGVSVDSFQVIGRHFWLKDSSSTVCTFIESCKVEFDPTLTAWIVNEWVAYTIGYWGRYFEGPPGGAGSYTDTVFLKSFIRANTESDVTIYLKLEDGYPLRNSGGDYYAKIYSWFGEGEVWREGKVDAVEHCQFGPSGYDHNTKIIDSSFYWDSTTSYMDYVFEVVSGEGEGKKCWLRNYGRDSDCDNSGWDSTGFIVPIYHDACFDTTTYYRIYQPSFEGEGGKFVENFDDRAWIGWAGINEVDSIASLEVSDSSFTGEDTTVASIDTTIDSIDPICGDSVLFQGSMQRSSAIPCPHCSTMLAVSYGSITPGEYDDSAISIPVWVYSDASELVQDTLTRHVRIDSNTFTSCYLTFSNSPCAEGKVLYEYPWTYYAKFFFIDTIGTEWREGTVDSATTIGSEGTWLEQCHTRLWDDTYAWDSTVSYNDYYFVVYAGKGVGIKTFLFNHVPCPACAVGWEGDGFLVPNYSSDCFDNTTQYKIYEPNLTADCYIETTFSYDTTFSYSIAWEYYTTTTYDTVYTDDQDKNRLIYSELPEDGGLGNWPPENEIYLTPGDGDYITGMKSLSDARHVDVPAHLLMVTKNASSYKIIPTSTAGLYDSWYISTRVGCVSNSAMSVGEGLVLFLDQNGVWAWDQRSKPQCISLLIDPIFEDLELEGLEATSAIYNPQDRHYYLSGPELLEIDTTIYIGDFIVDFIAGNDVWTHRIDSAGVKIGTPDTLAATYAGVYDQRIATDTAGRYVISYLLGATPYIQRFGADDQEVGDSIRVCDVQRITNAASVGAEVTMDNDGNIICCWADTSGGDMKTIDIYCQYIDWDDGKIDTNFVVNSNWAVNDHTQNGHHGVEINNDGLFVVVWHDTRDAEAGPVDEEVYGQRYQVHDGDSVEALGANFNISEINAGGCGAWGQGVSVSNENFVVVWHSFEGNSSQDVWKRLYTIGGVALESRTAVNVQASGRNHGWPRVDMNDWGEYVIAYLNDENLEDPYNIQFRKYSLTTAVGGEIEPMPQTFPTAITPDVALANSHIFVVVWSDTRVGPANTYTFYQAYRWEDTLSVNVILADSSVLGSNDLEVFIDMPDFMNIDTSCYTLAWNIDYHGWSKESFSASAYAYQHGLTDPVKVLFADPEETKVYNYGTQADDVGNAVILTYQSPYLSFVQNPSWDVVMSYATLEAFLDTGEVYVYWYRDYSELVHVDTFSCGGDCREEIRLPSDVTGHNISMKIITGVEIDDFTLSGYWWEYLINRWRK